MRLQEYDISTQFNAFVVESRRITPEDSEDEVRDIGLDVDGNLNIQVGQHVGVIAPGQKDFGQKYHLRLYTVADIPQQTPEGKTRVHLCVKRCWYIDEYSGEEYRGVASHYLCSLRPGDRLKLTGPYGQAFAVPDEPDATLIMIGAGTGIAPFRAFVKYLYQHPDQFQGRIWLFHGARTGMEMLYMNDQQDDFAEYYDRDTFEAISALSRQPAWSNDIDWQGAITSPRLEIWKLLESSKTYVYLAGLEQIRNELDEVFSQLAGGPKRWQRRKAELAAGGRWIELLY